MTFPKTPLPSALVALLLISACPAPEPFFPPPPIEPEPIVETRWDGGVLHIGRMSAQGAFETTQRYELERGAQGGGGRHLWVAYRVTNSVVGEVTMAAAVTRVRDGQFLGLARQRTRFAEVDGGYESRTLQRVVLCPPPAGVQLSIEPLRLDAWVELVEFGAPLGQQSVVFEPVCDACQAECGG